MEKNTLIENDSNGPLPLQFKDSAYFTPKNSEFVLRQSDALKYLNWYEAQGLTTLGYEVWYETMP